MSAKMFTFDKFFEVTASDIISLNSILSSIFSARSLKISEASTVLGLFSFGNDESIKLCLMIMGENNKSKSSSII